MLNNIRLHIEEDEGLQLQHEEALATTISERRPLNHQAFAQNIPSLLPYLSLSSKNISVFANRYGETNIVDYGTGRTLYGTHVSEQVKAQVDRFCNAPLKVTLDSGVPNCKAASDVTASLPEQPAFQEMKCRSPLPASIDCLVVLGLGLGEYLVDLLSRVTVKNLIIYEPEVQYFCCSALVNDWRQFFQQASQQGTSVFFQLEKDARNIVADICELNENVPIQEFFVYQHYRHPVFDSVVNALRCSSWQTLITTGISFSPEYSRDSFVPRWQLPFSPLGCTDVSEDMARFKANLAAFERYFPDIYRQFKHYSPKHWLPVVQPDQDVNLIRKDDLTNWYGEHPRQESERCVEGFERRPNKDGLVLGYNGEKLKHYVHYRFVKETENLLKAQEEEVGQLPDTIPSLIVFGIGAGYSLQRMLETHDVEKLFVCEPNTDFFYASLFAIDWQQLLQRVDEKGGRVYINIGDDGSHLFRDLLNQFYSIGPYILANTYFHQGYYNAALAEAIGQLREQLQVVISMGEYFDHARYGIAHTKHAFEQGAPFLKKAARRHLSQTDKDVPVFFVGNGPSLDASIELIKESQPSAIIVSCGTALKVLHKHGIVPDFHAEIEQNRSTYDWAVRIGDFDYLKGISLLSCNGIHPDTCALYADVFNVFKEGESSTVSTMSALQDYEFEVLQFAFPTVTNFAVNFFCALGFNQFYLVGVDMGFASDEYHHSKNSDYYDQNGKPIYDYKKANNTSLVVKGNFRPRVFTKHEFKVAKGVLEQSLAAHRVECYNCSDGAYIAGSQPLAMNYVLLVSAPEDKLSCIQSIKNECFVTLPPSVFEQHYRAKFDTALLLDELHKFRAVVAHARQEDMTVSELIEKQKQMLFASYARGQSLLFYYLYGTVNYANAVFSKLLNYQEDDSAEALNRAVQEWDKTLARVEEQLQFGPDDVDISSSLPTYRNKVFLTELTKTYKTALIMVDCPIVEGYLITCCEAFDVDYTLYREMAEDQDSEFDLLFVFDSEQKYTHTDFASLSDTYCWKKAVYGSYEYFTPDTVSAFESAAQNVVLIQCRPGIARQIFDFNDVGIVSAGANIGCWMFFYVFDNERFSVVLPKVTATRLAQPSENNREEALFAPLSGAPVIETAMYVARPREHMAHAHQSVDALGNRGCVRHSPLGIEDIVSTWLEKKDVVKILRSNVLDRLPDIERWVEQQVK
ncbi:DUF115 domain-containing protein [Aestuariibacter halophilus]|uniref:DUF115 domain-containing protein n=1 Tax=Fluctibacter halophilus TaxID=226011 RepID=A0ABS8G3D4_9ALTE|nr:6-hydroxymethylpterin diphosphokinase MptE-like protein [Aestuariibacter halophilus]MCC2615102.1 DUF115 domain-containing protein [Aestuariibacter halophilus]